VGLSRTSLGWLGVAGAAFAAAVALTMMITWVEGGVLEHGALGAGGATEVYQTVGIYTSVDESSEVAGQYTISYSENAAGDNTRLVFSIPAGEAPILVLSNLIDARGCTSLRSPEDITLNETQGGGVNVTIAPAIKKSKDEETVYLVVPKPSKTRAIEVSCQIQQASHAETFTSRRLPLLYDNERMASLSAGLPLEATPGFSMVGLAQLEPAPEVLFSFAKIPGAKNMHFLGGFDALDWNSRDTSRLAQPDEFIQVFWEDEYRQQFRDILLIVIGTLIGIGVTVTIEGLRPFIEHLEKRTPRAAPAPPAPIEDSPPTD
jgi:hypothetical protein